MERNTITIDGQDVTFGPFVVGSIPKLVNVNWQAEVCLAALGGGNERLVRVIHAIRTGVEQGIIRCEHLGAIERALGRDEVLDAFDLPYSHSVFGRLAVAWVTGSGVVISLLNEEFVSLWEESVAGCPV